MAFDVAAGLSCGLYGSGVAMDGVERVMSRDETDEHQAGGTEAAFAAETARLAAALMALEARLDGGDGDGEALRAARDEAEAQRTECARLRASNERLREVCASLREGSGDLDAAIGAELEAIAAQRAAEKAELDRLIRAVATLTEVPA